MAKKVEEMMGPPVTGAGDVLVSRDQGYTKTPVVRETHFPNMICDRFDLR